ncbi:MAG TPA: alanine racemase [Myxococcota bacterium]|nr:alanine racemase [Myxococcota bacterium]
MHPAWIEIDLKQFKSNLLLLKKALPYVRICLPVKANAYGHGLCAMAKAATEVGVEYLAVAHLSEAIKLRQASINTPILVLGAIHEEQIADLLSYELEFSISSSFKAMMVAKKCQLLKKRCRVHLEVDTGMRRTGMRPETAAKLFSTLKNDPYFDVVGIYSHLASGAHANDPIACSQIKAFKTLVSSPPFSELSLLCHLANSSGTLNFPEAYFDMVRPALIAFGYVPEEVPQQFRALSPCFSLKARVSYFKVVEKGEGVSYGHSYIAPKRSRIVTIPVGYGDGFRRELSNRGFVLMRGQRFPIVGAICMDQFMVDVGEHSVYVGDEVVLIGRQGDQEITVKEIASLCNTIPYEILCLFNERIPRIYSN